MTLQELSPQYARQAETVARRLRELRQQELAEGDPQVAQTLRQRQQELRPLLREARELAEHTAHYYDRRYIRRENTASDMAGIPYDPLDMASLQLWARENRDDNRLQIERLLRNLPMAVEQDLTDRQRQILRMRYSQSMTVSSIARELGINKSTVSRTLSNSTMKLYRSLRYSL